MGRIGDQNRQLKSKNLESIYLHRLIEIYDEENIRLKDLLNAQNPVSQDEINRIIENHRKIKEQIENLLKMRNRSGREQISSSYNNSDQQMIQRLTQGNKSLLAELEGLRRMNDQKDGGLRDLQNRINELQQDNKQDDHNMIIELSNLKSENGSLKQEVESLQKMVENMQRDMGSRSGGRQGSPYSNSRSQGREGQLRDSEIRRLQDIERRFSQLQQEMDNKDRKFEGLSNSNHELLQTNKILNDDILKLEQLVTKRENELTELDQQRNRYINQIAQNSSKNGSNSQLVQEKEMAIRQLEGIISNLELDEAKDKQQIQEMDRRMAGLMEQILSKDQENQRLGQSIEKLQQENFELQQLSPRKESIGNVNSTMKTDPNESSFFGGNRDNSTRNSGGGEDPENLRMIQENKEYAEEIRRLNSQISQIAPLEQELESSRQQVRQLENIQQQQSRGSEDRRRNSNTSNSRQLEELQKQIQQSHVDSEQLYKEIDHLKDEVRNGDQKYKIIISELKQENENIKNQIAEPFLIPEVKQHLLDADVQIQNLNRDRQESENKLINLGSQLGRSQNEVAVLQKEISGLEDELTTTRQNSNQRQRDRDSEKREREMKGIEEENERLVQRLKMAEEEISRLTEEIHSLKNDGNSRATSQRGGYPSIEAEGSEQSNSRYGDQTHGYQSPKDEKEQLRQSNMMLKRKVTEIENDYKGVSSELQSLGDQLSQVMDQNRHLQDENENLKSSKNSPSSSRHGATTHAQQNYQRQSQEPSAELENLKEKLQQVNSENQEMAKQVQGMYSSEELREAIKQAESKTDSLLATQRKEAFSRLSELETENKRLKSELQKNTTAKPGVGNRPDFGSTADSGQFRMTTPIKGGDSSMDKSEKEKAQLRRQIGDYENELLQVRDELKMYKERDGNNGQSGGQRDKMRASRFSNQGQDQERSDLRGSGQRNEDSRYGDSASPNKRGSRSHGRDNSSEKFGLVSQKSMEELGNNVNEFGTANKDLEFAIQALQVKISELIAQRNTPRGSGYGQIRGSGVHQSRNSFTNQQKQGFSGKEGESNMELFADLLAELALQIEILYSQKKNHTEMFKAVLLNYANLVEQRQSQIGPLVMKAITQMREVTYDEEIINLEELKDEYMHKANTQEIENQNHLKRINDLTSSSKKNQQYVETVLQDVSNLQGKETSLKGELAGIQQELTILKDDFERSQRTIVIL